MRHTKKDVIDCPDIIDTRDLQARIDELTDERDSFVIGSPDGEETPAPEQWERENPEEAEELTALEAFAEEVRGYCSDYRHGATLIHEDFFQSYARELAEDIGAIQPNQNWPNNCIDWEQAAEELKIDYSTAELNGTTYYFRA